MEAPRYTAKEIEDGLYSGMDPDVELVTAQYYDALRAELARVKAESLRVVPIEQHELTHWEVAMVVFLNGATTIYERYDSDDGKLVRLERWEDE